MRAGSMARYWDRAAREDAFHYVDSREPLGGPDEEAFWLGGRQAVAQLLGDLGVELTGSEDLVEIGCGIGRLTRALAAQVRSVHALDVSAEMVAAARKYNSHVDNVTWLTGDGCTLAPLPDGAFDGCVSFVVFQHLPDPGLTYGYVREMGRVLRPGGWAAFHVSNDPRVHERPSGARRLRHAILSRRYHHPAWWGSAVEIPRLKSVAHESGLEIERVENEGQQFCFVLARRRQPNLLG